MLKTIKQEVIRSAGTYMKADSANTVPALGENFVVTSGGMVGGGTTTVSYVNHWIDVDNDTDKVISLDMDKYLAFVTTQAKLKTTPAFDAVGVFGNTTSRTETNLFGPYTQKYMNYTEYSWNHNDVAGDGSGLDDTGLTPDEYIKKSSTKADTAPNWYARNGTRDKDTSFIGSINLDRALGADKDVKDVNYMMAWNQPHSGNYDVPEAMAWIAKVVAKAGDSWKTALSAVSRHGRRRSAMAAKLSRKVADWLLDGTRMSRADLPLPHEQGAVVEPCALRAARPVTGLFC
ncbi:hypothetical protein [Streptomyces canus]|uniref:hypothetical protein n=1 Tax=Streptomyces canus TaxID=58343 RepID=UPI00324F80AE